MNSEISELKNAMEAYFHEQHALQKSTIEQLIKIDKQNRALLAIFGSAAKVIGSKE